MTHMNLPCRASEGGERAVWCRVCQAAESRRVPLISLRNDLVVELGDVPLGLEPLTDGEWACLFLRASNLFPELLPRLEAIRKRFRS